MAALLSLEAPAAAGTVAVPRTCPGCNCAGRHVDDIVAIGSGVLAFRRFAQSFPFLALNYQELLRSERAVKHVPQSLHLVALPLDVHLAEGLCKIVIQVLLHVQLLYNLGTHYCLSDSVQNQV